MVSGPDLIGAVHDLQVVEQEGAKASLQQEQLLKYISLQSQMHPLGGEVPYLQETSIALLLFCQNRSVFELSLTMLTKKRTWGCYRKLRDWAEGAS